MKSRLSERLLPPAQSGLSLIHIFFQLEAKQKQGKDTLRTKMSIKRQEIEKKQRPVSKEIGPGARSACRDAED